MVISIKRPGRILIAISYLLLILHPMGHTNAASPVPKVPGGNGLLLLDLNVKAPSAVMTLRNTRGKESVIELTPNHGRWLLKPLPKGDYQIINIKVPYFDLPYVNHTGENPGWRIQIKPGQLNYAGRIEVAKERTENFVAIKKLNRLVTDLPDIRTELAAVLAIYPLTDGNYLRDDFAKSALAAGTSHD